MLLRGWAGIEGSAHRADDGRDGSPGAGEATGEDRMGMGTPATPHGEHFEINRRRNWRNRKHLRHDLFRCEK